MESKELAFEALAHRAPPRVPWTLYLAGPLRRSLERLWGPRGSWPCPGDDLVRVLWEVEAVDVDPKHFKDSFGCDWVRDESGYMFVNPPLSEPDASRIPRIELFTGDDERRVLDERAARPDAFIFYQFTMTFGERLWALRGMEQILMDYLLEPAFVYAALDVLLEMHLKALDAVLRLPVDGVTFGDDYGSQRGLMISRDVFVRYFKPRLRTMYDKVRSAGKVVGHHSCGDNTGILGDLVDIGLEVFHPLQPEAMDIRRIKREFGRHLTFRGGIGTQGAVVFGTPEQARAEVRQAARVLCEGGGYFLETTKPLPPETPIENAVAVIDEMTRAMNYQFE